MKIQNMFDILKNILLDDIYPLNPLSTNAKQRNIKLIDLCFPSIYSASQHLHASTYILCILDSYLDGEMLNAEHTHVFGNNHLCSVAFHRHVKHI